ncbi:MAG: ACT domain-containing protein [Mariniphaga sp.]|nr:acetolactate synthase [Mariniphaga sp.]MDD4226821.1 acetolactate synthase [Mariniphaga sp.]MDD4425906.1 acetolactate synthase [Mariniphaga sp.]
MKAKQVTVFLENKSGRLNEVAQILGNANINISAFTVADTSDFGVLRLIVSDPVKACEVLKENLFSVRTTDVVLVNSPNRPGALSRMLQILSGEGIFIEYLYAFSMNDETAVIAIRPTDVDRCVQILENHKDELSSGSGDYKF